MLLGIEGGLLHDVGWSDLVPKRLRQMPVCQVEQTTPYRLEQQPDRVRLADPGRIEDVRDTGGCQAGGTWGDWGFMGMQHCVFLPITTSSGRSNGDLPRREQCIDSIRIRHN